MVKQYENPELEIYEFKETDFVVTIQTSNGTGNEGSDFDSWIEQTQ